MAPANGLHWPANTAFNPFICRCVPPGVEYQARARTLLYRSPNAAVPRPPKVAGSVAVVTAGTADLSVAEECLAVAEHIGCYAFKVCCVTGVKAWHVRPAMACVTLVQVMHRHAQLNIAIALGKP